MREIVAKRVGHKDFAKQSYEVVYKRLLKRSNSWSANALDVAKLQPRQGGSCSTPQ